MIRQILIRSCEHQHYRRAGQLAMLDLFGYSLEIVDVVWGLHADYHSKEEIMESMLKMDAPQKILQYSSSVYSFSADELMMRTLVRVQETQKNTLIIEDDHYLIMNRKLFEEKLRKLEKVVGKNFGVIQLQNRGQYTGKMPIVPIEGAEDFMRGSVRSSHTMLFVTPHGADMLLEYLRNPTTPMSIENGLPAFLYDKDWVFSTIEPEKFVHPSRVLHGESIGVKHTLDPNLKDRANQKSIDRHKHILEYYKL